MGLSNASEVVKTYVDKKTEQGSLVKKVNFVDATDVSLKKLTMTHTLKKLKEIPKRDKYIINDKQLK